MDRAMITVPATKETRLLCNEETDAIFRDAIRGIWCG